MIFSLFWRENATMSFLSPLSAIAACSAEQVTCLLSSQEHIRVIGRSNRITQKDIIISFTQDAKERLFQNNSRQQEQNALDEYTFTYFNHHESWAAALTSVIAISLALR